MVLFTYIVAVLFVLVGLMKLSGKPKEMFVKLGMPIWSMYLIGVVEIVGAAGLVWGDYTMWASYLLGVILIGAIGSHLRIKDTKGVMMPIGFLVLLIINYYVYVV